MKRLIAVRGASSGHVAEIDLDVIEDMMDLYVKYAPAERRSIGVFMRIAKLKAQLSNLEVYETAKNQKEIEDRLDSEIDYLDITTMEDDDETDRM